MGRVLVVDDHAPTRAALRKIIAYLGHDAVGAHDGDEAMWLMAETDFDLVIADHLMARVTGIELLTAVRDDSRMRKLPVIVYTAVNDPIFRQQAMKIGATAVYTKPDLKFVDIRQLLARYVGAGGTMREAS